MIITNTRDPIQPYPDVAIGTFQLNNTTYYTLQHLPCPVGTYNLIPHTINNGPLKGMDTYCLVNESLGVYLNDDGIPGHRYEILIHSGNWVSNSEGCILVGLERDTLQPLPSISSSLVVFGIVIAYLGGPNQIGNSWIIQ